MVDLKKTQSNPEEQFWDELDGVHAGMLGVEGSGQHMQPMAPELDRKANTIWFFSRRDSDLVKALKGGAKAHFCVVGKNQDYHACMSGTLAENPDRSKIDQYWSQVVAAWFAKGKEDPSLTLLEFKLNDAAIWASSSNAIKFGWEIAKANMTGEEPDVGVRAHIRFVQL
jgi:general stress protein 26